MGRPPKHPTWSERMEEYAPEEKEMIVEIMAITGYSNGSIPGCASWRSGEVRKLPFSTVARLNNDLPGNWKVLFPKPEENG